MKKLIGVFLLSLPMLAVASNCDEISANIAEKIKNNGVEPSQFQLKLEPSDKSEQQIEGKIVGSCDRGQQRIVYVRLDGFATQTQTQTQSANTKEETENSKAKPSTNTPTESTPAEGKLPVKN
ncbi:MULTISPECIES: DUF1161 domain-containing protein [unclassified Gilliamella]|uniref:DUF1161 domain-containing protein n=1 Tax=unclassified Gilliamella TaxID=2685620 RepID=UPI0004617D29|nr:DUF1161 domain-containing protein [Gilliamella apicola]KDN09756.1 putative outer membrane protein [Gilliamella apicola]OCG57393.1 hypothetical protein A9G38_08070 [Gilliamella apicola]OCG63881.1 hypothetical protein A9G37_08075 [Gilliamella apicola]